MRFVTKQVLDLGDREAVQDAYQKREDDYLERIRPHLPGGFVKEYEANRGFHDFLIKSIRLSKSKKGLPSIAIVLRLSKRKYKVVYRGVSGFSINEIDFEMKKCLGLICVDEFRILEDKTISQEIMLTVQGNIKINFKTVKIKRI